MKLRKKIKIKIKQQKETQRRIPKTILYYKSCFGFCSLSPLTKAKRIKRVN